MRRCSNLGLVLAVILLLCAGCSSTPTAPSESSNTGDQPNNVSFNKDDYPAFPDGDAGADPAVPAEAGGKGFDGQGWTTNTSYDLISDPRAQKGGVFREAILDFPSTLRYYGPNVTAWNQMVNSMVYETLMGLHPTSLEYIPGLASHWQISEDKKQFRFRIDPNARWSDGQPVTAEDVVASWKLAVDKTLQDPYRFVTFGKFEQPVAESKYIVRVRAKTESWQNFLNFSNGLFIYPAHVLKGMTGEAYLKQYNDKMLPNTGPYMVSPQDVAKGQSITIRRRKDYWAAKHRRNVGTSNFDDVQQIVVRDRNLEFEMFKRGDLDLYNVNRAQMWVEELDYENIKRGLNQKRKIFNHNPNGVAGLAINMRREPYNDIRVRKALRHLFNRELMIEKLMYNEYVPINSMYPGSVYENPNNEKLKYEPQTAVKLLAEAGWKDRDGQGRLVKNGRPLAIEILYYDKASERFFTVFQEDLRKVGITLNLRLVTWETMIKLIDERTFDLVSVAYTGTIFPNPEDNLLSKMADENNTNNITGFKNQRADEIIALYDKEFSIDERIKLLRELDAIVMNEHHWIFEWTANYQRVAYWHKFGQPKGILTRIGDYRDIPSMWWIDPQKVQRLEEARRDTSINLGEGPAEDKYWLDFARVEDEKETEAAPR